MLGTHPIVRYLNQNGRQIFIVIIAVVMFFLILRILNNIEENKIKQEQEETNTYYTEITNANEHAKIIKQFLDYCKSGDESNAYALLSSKTKQEKYQNQTEFNNNYILKFFSENNNYTITYNSENNNQYYYVVTITKDILSSGKVDKEPVVQDFIITNENGEDKIII